MMVGNGQPVYVHALPALQCPQMSFGQDVNHMVYQNAAYDGGSEFNPGAANGAVHGANGAASGGVAAVIVDGNSMDTAENEAGKNLLFDCSCAKL